MEFLCLHRMSNCVWMLPERSCLYLVSVHELLADHILTDAGGRHQVVELVEEFHTALMVLRCSFTQLVPQD